MTDWKDKDLEERIKEYEERLSTISDENIDERKAMEFRISKMKEALQEQSPLNS